MPMLSRRTMLAGGMFTLATAGTEVHAKVPLSEQPAPGFYRYRVGDIEIIPVNDGVSRMPITEDFVRNVPKPQVSAALDALFMEREFYTGPYNPILINNGKQLALVDTGTGEGGYKASGGINGRLMINLAAAGVRPSDIDVVILSHYHGDHINGLVMADGSVAFPNAEILAPTAEHKFWMDDGEMSRAATPRVDATFKNARKVMTPDILKRIRTYEADKDVISGVTCISTPGHTPGHCSLVVSSGSKSVYVQGDVTHAPYLFARHPGWHFMLDVDPVMAETTRRKVYDMLVAERMAVQGFHYPFPALAHVERTADGYREVMVQWSPVL